MCQTGHEHEVSRVARKKSTAPVQMTSTGAGSTVLPGVPLEPWARPAGPIAPDAPSAAVDGPATFHDPALELAAAHAEAQRRRAVEQPVAPPVAAPEPVASVAIPASAVAVETVPVAAVSAPAIAAPAEPVLVTVGATATAAAITTIGAPGALRDPAYDQVPSPSMAPVETLAPPAFDLDPEAAVAATELAPQPHRHGAPPADEPATRRRGRAPKEPKAPKQEKAPTQEKAPKQPKPPKALSADDPGSKKRGIRPGLIVILGAVLVAAVVGAFVWPGFLVSSDVPNQSQVPSSPVVSQPIGPAIHTPATIGNLARITGAPATALASAAAATALNGLSKPVSAVYGTAGTPSVQVIGWQAYGDVAGAAIGQAFAGFTAANSAAVTTMSSPKVSGGQLTCGSATVAGAPSTLCFFTGNHLFGSITVMHPATAAAGTATAVTVYDAVTASA